MRKKMVGVVYEGVLPNNSKNNLMLLVLIAGIGILTLWYLTKEKKT